MVVNNVILLGEYGSVAQGTSGPNSDHDYMGIYIETPEQIFGLNKQVESVRVKDGGADEKSKPGESDTTYHTLRKFATLAAQGNPTVGSLLHLPKYEPYEAIDSMGGAAISYHVPGYTGEGEALVDNRDLFWSKRAGHAYLGYLKSQIKALSGERGIKRPELVNSHGYDTKFGYHAYRLGIQGLQYMLERTPQIPMEGAHLTYALEIRAGEMPLEELMWHLRDMQNVLQEILSEEKDIPDDPEYDKINSLVTKIHQDWWDYC